jgi:hypothetical protein
LKAPEEEHIVMVGKVLAWLDGGARSPARAGKEESIEGAAEGVIVF